MSSEMYNKTKPLFAITQQSQNKEHQLHILYIVVITLFIINFPPS